MFPGRNPGTLVKAYRYLSLKIAKLNNADRPINACWLYIILRYIAKRGFGLYLHGVWRCLKLVNQERPTLFYLCNACSGLGVIIVFDMKKIYFCLLACVVAFAGCSKDEDPGRSYTEQQEKALSVFNGTWADTQFSNLGDYPGAELQPDPDKIIFGTQNNKPVEIYENDFIEGERLLFSAFGELVYHSEGYEDVPCFYWLSNAADELRLYRTSTKKLYKKFALSIKSDTKMNLHDPDLSLPYIFVKQ